MKSILKQIAKGLLLVPALLVGLSVAVPVTANAACTNELTISGGADCAAGTQQEGTSLFDQGGIFQKITNILLFLVGAISVIMLIIGGIRYVISAGDQNQVTGAKNTIMYAIVGIVVAFLAFAAVNFVVTRLAGE